MSQDSRKVRFGLWYDFRNPPQWRQPLLECAPSVRAIGHAKSGECYPGNARGISATLGQSSAIKKMEGVRGEYGSERDVSTMWIEAVNTVPASQRAWHTKFSHNTPVK